MEAQRRRSRSIGRAWIERELLRERAVWGSEEANPFAKWRLAEQRRVLSSAHRFAAQLQTTTLALEYDHQLVQLVIQQQQQQLHRHTHRSRSRKSFSASREPSSTWTIAL